MYKDPSSNHPQSECRCDILVSENTEKFIIDIAITDPTCAVAIRKGSSDTALVAAKDKEKDKCLDYKKFLTPETFEHFVPFVLESTGRFGTSAKNFIDRICKLDKMDLEYSESTRLARQSFVHSVSNILVSTDAIIARLTRNREAAAI
jgi:hypothetical protein